MILSNFVFLSEEVFIKENIFFSEKCCWKAILIVDIIKINNLTELIISGVYINYIT